jgi:tellurite resistance protein TerC
MENSLLFWVGFNAFVVVLLLLDLLVFNRKAHEIKLREALSWSVFWVALSLAFNYLVYRTMGPQQGLEWLTGYRASTSTAFCFGGFWARSSCGLCSSW